MPGVPIDIGYIDPEGNSINLPDVYRHSRHVGE